MNIRGNSVAPIASALLLSVVILLAGSGKSHAQVSDIDNVKAAIAGYHAALESVDPSKMGPLWVHEPDVMLVNPQDKKIVIGWDAIKQEWESSFGTRESLKIRQEDGPYIQVKGDVAWSTGIVNAAFKLKTGVALEVPILESDVFEKRSGAWLLVSHTASPRKQ